ncbi:MAG: DUF4126 domain-containing protein [Verrucomicrobiota bacterium]|nr:DUF4126 domain-containing protein [Verrucomicrobiota bacterium]
METLQLIAIALGLAALCGINLYLTLFLTGLTLKFGWITLLPEMEGLNLLQDPVVLTITGLLYAVEFVVDKIPWVDSVWDIAHTIIRPVGAVFLVTKALSSSHNPVLEFVCVLLAGVFALAAHVVKTGARANANLTAQPMTNAILSLSEDIFVAVAFFLLHRYPSYSLIALVGFILGVILIAPWLSRNFYAQFHYMLGRLKMRDFEKDPERVILPTVLPYKFEARLKTQKDPDEKFEWAMACFTGKMTHVGRNVPGFIIQTSNRNALYFIGRKNGKSVYRNMRFLDCRVRFEECFLFDEIEIKDVKKKYYYNLRFPKHHQAYARKVFDHLSAYLHRLIDTEKLKTDGSK